MGYFILTTGWILYFFLHSLLAADRVKQWSEKVMGRQFRYYRLLYSLYSTVGLILLLVVNGSIKAPNFFESKGMIRYLSLVLTTFGVMTIQLSFWQYSLKSFIGAKAEISQFKTDGVLKYIRHPIYTGLILVTLGFFLFVPNLPTLITCVCIFLYLPIGIYLEEKKLVKVFGDEYRQYKMKVPGLIPWFQDSEK